MAIILPELPYDKDALEPHISARTLEFHYGKHHRAYVDKTNAMIEGTALANADLETIIRETAGKADQTGLFNNAAQAWNHAFYWQCMRPGGGGAPTGAILEKIDSDLGGYEKFAEALKNAGATQFGSGWAWLVLRNERLEIMKTANADTPLAEGLRPLLTVDVWEHAYYLNYQNRRPDYITAFFNVINWDEVSKRYKAAL